MRNCSYGFEIYLVNVKTIRTIAHIFVAFSEKLNFTDIASIFYSNIPFITGKNGKNGRTLIKKSMN